MAGASTCASHLSGEREKDFGSPTPAPCSGTQGSAGDSRLARGAARKKLGDVKGESDFMTWMRAYAQNFTFKTGETRHLVGILNQITGEDWQPWFERFVYGTEMPKVK